MFFDTIISLNQLIIQIFIYFEELNYLLSNKYFLLMFAHTN